ncbi:MAG: tetratricopeptide repeat protein, partial [Microcoleus sp. SIO2G3]|nr:tetratricopeptide repeat protein [Microcoleus sp. SIO2G3]
MSLHVPMMGINTATKTAIDYFNQGNQLKQEGQFVEAIAAYKAAIDRDASNFWYPYQIGEILLKLDDIEGAITHLQAAIRLNSSFSWSHHFLGEALARKGQIVEAETAFRQAIALDANCSWSYYGLAEILATQEKFQEAINCCCRSIELYPVFHGAHHCLRNLLSRHNQLGQGETWYRQVLATNENSWLHHFL